MTLSSSPADKLTVDRLAQDPALSQRLERVFGSASDPMTALEQRARETLPEFDVIVWEGDAQTFEFTFVSASAEAVLGYPCRRWLTEPTFWCDTVVHPQDRNDAIAYCALATGQGRDHDFVYRALASDGRTVWLHDIVRVVIGAKGIAQHLRGVMTVIQEESAKT